MADVDAKLLQSDEAGDAGASDNEDAGADEEAMAAELNQRQVLAKQRAAAASNLARVSQVMQNQKQAQVAQQRSAAQAAMAPAASPGRAPAAGAAGQGAESSEAEEAEQDEEARAQALQQQQQQAALQQQQQQAGEKKEGGSLLDKLKSKMKGLKQAMQEASAKMLKFAWSIMVESFGSAVIIVDFVVFLGLVMGNDAICKLGYEWTPKEIAILQPTEAKAMGEKLGMIEKAGCCCLSGCWGLITIIIIGLIGTFAFIYMHPIDAIVQLGQAIVDLVKSFF